MGGTMNHDHLTGIYRTSTSQGKQYAFVECGRLGFRVSRRTYEAEGYDPPFDQLPSQDELERGARSELFKAPATVAHNFGMNAS
jgi:hypothetical protein